MDTPSLAVPTLWVVDAKADADIVAGIVKALWNPNTKALLERGHPVGKQIVLDRALDFTALPLHPGAERAYRELGKVPTVRPIEGPGNQ